MKKMKNKILEIIHGFTLRLPQRIALRNGMRITTFGTASNSLFWSIFTSREYLSFVPHLSRLNKQPVICLDCGAALGYFSLLMEHLQRSGTLPWKPLEYHLIEPMKTNFSRLQRTVPGNITRYTLYNCVVGKKHGSATFYFNPLSPWGGSTFDRGLLNQKQTIDHMDLSGLLSDFPSIVKLDIEGSEFDWLETYKDNLENMLALILEWHTEFGNRDAAMDLLKSRGFVAVHQSLNKGNRIVEMFVKAKHYQTQGGT